MILILKLSALWVFGYGLVNRILDIIGEKLFGKSKDYGINTIVLLGVFLFHFNILLGTEINWQILLLPSIFILISHILIMLGRQSVTKNFHETNLQCEMIQYVVNIYNSPLLFLYLGIKPKSFEEFKTIISTLIILFSKLCLVILIPLIYYDFIIWDEKVKIIIYLSLLIPITYRLLSMLIEANEFINSESFGKKVLYYSIFDYLQSTIEIISIGYLGYQLTKSSSEEFLIFFGILIFIFIAFILIPFKINLNRVKIIKIEYNNWIKENLLKLKKELNSNNENTSKIIKNTINNFQSRIDNLAQERKYINFFVMYMYSLTNNEIIEDMENKKESYNYIQTLTISSYFDKEKDKYKFEVLNRAIHLILPLYHHNKLQYYLSMLNNININDAKDIIDSWILNYDKDNKELNIDLLSFMISYNKFLKLIGKGYIKEVLKLMLETSFIPKKDVIIIQARLSELETMKMLGTIHDNEYHVNLNKVVESSILLLNKVLEKSKN